MLKSIALATAVLSLNAGSFNIQPKEVSWNDNVTQESSYLSNKTITKTSYVNNEQEWYVNIANKNTYTYEDQYTTVETTIITRFNYEIYCSDENTIDGGVSEVYRDIQIYSHYKTFNEDNAKIYNLYNNQQIYSNFSDNKGTIYYYAINDATINTTKKYDATNDTKTSILAIKGAETIETLNTAQQNFLTAYNNTTKNTPTYVENTLNGKNVTLYSENEGFDPAPYEIFTYQQIYGYSTLQLSYQNEILETDAEYQTWFDSFKEIQNGQTIWNYKGSSTTQSTINNTLSISVDSGTASTTEVIDIGGLMWDIIGMPFTFINQAFNVTLFAGTIYEFNIGNLIKGIIAILSLLFIIKLFTRGIDVLGEYNNTIGSARDRREDRAWKREERQMKRESHAKEMATNKNEKTVTVINKKE